MPSKHFLCSRLKQAIHALSCVLNQLNGLFVAEFCHFLSSKRDSSLKFGEKFLDVVDKGGDIVNEMLKFRPMIYRPASKL
jgi:hypothetical protein